MNYNILGQKSWLSTVITLAISKQWFCTNLSARDLLFAKQKSEEQNPFSLCGKQSRSRFAIANIAFCIQTLQSIAF